jgi:hypothetical protein
MHAKKYDMKKEAKITYSHDDRWMQFEAEDISEEEKELIFIEITMGQGEWAHLILTKASWCRYAFPLFHN